MICKISLIIACAFSVIIATDVEETGIWQPKPTCNLIGYSRKINIPGCIEFSVTTNACRGFCESFSISTKFSSGPFRTDRQPITSVGLCCNIMESEDLKVKVRCLDGVREVTFGSATSCSCFHCKKS